MVTCSKFQSIKFSRPGVLGPDICARASFQFSFGRWPVRIFAGAPDILTDIFRFSLPTGKIRNKSLKHVITASFHILCNPVFSGDTFWVVDSHCINYKQAKLTNPCNGCWITYQEKQGLFSCDVTRFLITDFVPVSSTNSSPYTKVVKR